MGFAFNRFFLKTDDSYFTKYPWRKLYLNNITPYIVSLKINSILIIIIPGKTYFNQGGF